MFDRRARRWQVQAERKSAKPGALAKACGVPRTRVERLAAEQIGITADTALRLSRALRTTPELWLNLQNSFDIKTSMLEIASELDQIEPVNKAA